VVSRVRRAAGRSQVIRWPFFLPHSRLGKRFAGAPVARPRGNTLPGGGAVEELCHFGTRGSPVKLHHGKGLAE
jgi:hypothetical protein